MAEKIKAVLFDLGDTLLDFGKIDLKPLFEQGGQLAYTYLQEQGYTLPKFRKYLQKHMHAIRFSVAKSHLLGKEFNSRKLIQKLCRLMGMEVSDAQLDELCWLWYEPLHRIATVEEGLAKMLADLKSRGLRLAVVSNTFIPGLALDRHLQEEDLLSLLPDRIYSCDVGRRKPHRVIFQQALERVDIKPEQGIFVGDSPRADIRGANRMGMVSVLKDPHGRHRRCRHIPTHRICSILELPDIIAQYNGV